MPASAAASASAVETPATQAGARVRSVFRRNADGSESDVTQPPPESKEAADEAGHGMIKEFLERSQQTFDEWQKRVDDRVQKVVETLAPWTVLHKELSELTQRLADLEKKLTDSEASAT